MLGKFFKTNKLIPFDDKIFILIIIFINLCKLLCFVDNSLLKNIGELFLKINVTGILVFSRYFAMLVKGNTSTYMLSVSMIAISMVMIVAHI